MRDQARGGVRILDADCGLGNVTRAPVRWARRNGIPGTRVARDVSILEVGSGEYEFVTTGLNLTRAMADVRHVAGRSDNEIADSNRSKTGGIT